MEIIIIFTIHNQYIYTHSLSIIKIIMTSSTSPFCIFPRCPSAPVQVSQWTTPVARVEWCSPPGRHPEIASRSLRSRSARTSAGRWKTSRGCQPRHNGWGQVVQRKKNCRRLTKCSKGMMCEGKIMENPRWQLVEILLFRWVCHEI
jgi:hypothetical protein